MEKMEFHRALEETSVVGGMERKRAPARKDLPFLFSTGKQRDAGEFSRCGAVFSLQGLKKNQVES